MSWVDRSNGYNASATREEREAADADWERRKLFIDYVDAAAEKLRVNKAAKDVVRAEEVGEVDIPELVRLDEFLTRPLEPVTHRIDGLWPIGGRVMLAAQWKAGKTTLRDNVIRSLVDGHTFLGVHHVVPPDGPVILLDFELDEQTLQRWLGAQGYKHPERVHIIPMKGHVSAFNILDEKLRTRWAETLSTISPSTIIVDCLRPILDALGLDENHEAGRFLVALDELVAACGAREILLVHHMGHGSERARGDSRLRDWPDAEWRLVRDKDEDDPTMDDPSGPRYFSAYGRDVDHPQTELTYDPDTRHLSIGEDASNRRVTGERRVLMNAKDAILAVVADQPGINKRALRAACAEHGGWRGTAIDAAADLLQSEGRIRVAKVGNTHLHYLEETSPPTLWDSPDTSGHDGTRKADTLVSGGPVGGPDTITFATEKAKPGHDQEPFDPAIGNSPPPAPLCALCHTQPPEPGRGICQACDTTTKTRKATA